MTCLLLCGCTDHTEFFVKNSNSKKLFQNIRLNYDRAISLDAYSREWKNGWRGYLTHESESDLSLSFVITRVDSGKTLASINGSVLGKVTVVFQQEGDHTKITIEETLLNGKFFDAELDDFIKDFIQQLNIEAIFTPNA